MPDTRVVDDRPHLETRVRAAVKRATSSSMGQQATATALGMAATKLGKSTQVTETGLNARPEVHRTDVPGETSSLIEPQINALKIEAMKLEESEKVTDTGSRGFTRQQESESVQQALRDASATNTQVCLTTPEYQLDTNHYEG